MQKQYDLYIKNIKKRLMIKKIVNIIICDITFILGILAVIYKARYEGGFLTCLREMTVDGTLFASLVALAYSVVNHVEIICDTELNYHFIYYLRLSSCVTELIILIVVLIGYLPIFPDNPIINRFDMINMHVIIPLLTIISFVFHDPPIGKLKPLIRLNGLIFLVIYTCSMIFCILVGIVTEKHIPYSFLNVTKNSIWYTAFAFVVIYGAGYLFSWLLSELNRKVSWLWFKGIAKRKLNIAETELHNNN